MCFHIIYNLLSLKSFKIISNIGLIKGNVFYFFIFINMLLVSLLLIPLLGIFMISAIPNSNKSLLAIKQSKTIALTTSIFNLFISLIVFVLFNFSTNQFQFVQEYHSINSFDFYLGVDGISIYFVLLTTIIMPISLLSN